MKIKKLHRKIVAYKKVVNEWNKKDKKERYAQRQRNYSYDPPFLAGVISQEILPRAYRILDALFCNIEVLGGTINDNLSLMVRNEKISIDIAEGQDKIDHIITKEEAQEILKYKDAQKNHSWAYEPKIRKYDYVFNGRLRISVCKSKYFRDTDKLSVEEKLGEILIDIYEQSEIVRIERVAREEAERKREEARHKEEIRREKYNEEVDKTIALENEAADYATACRIRDYVNAIANTSEGNNENMTEWVQWALKKADWFDPTVARDDEYLGKREHKKNSQDKVLKKYGGYWY